MAYLNTMMKSRSPLSHAFSDMRLYRAEQIFNNSSLARLYFRSYIHTRTELDGFTVHHNAVRDGLHNHR
jgi:hypothetical protein